MNIEDKYVIHLMPNGDFSVKFLTFDEIANNREVGASIYDGFKAGFFVKTFANMKEPEYILNNISVARMPDDELAEVRNKEIGFVFRFVFEEPATCLLE